MFNHAFQALLFEKHEESHANQLISIDQNEIKIVLKIKNVISAYNCWLKNATFSIKPANDYITSYIIK